MIAVSDAVLVLVSVTVLGSGLYRWQNNVEQAALASQRPALPTDNRQQLSPAAVPAEQNTLAARREPIRGAESFANEQTNAGAAQGNVPQVENTPQVSTAQTRVITDTRTPASVVIADDDGTIQDDSGLVDAPLYGSYVVQSGDSLSLIAEQYGTSVRQLQEINELEGTLIVVGQELRYPLPAN